MPRKKLKNTSRAKKATAKRPAKATRLNSVETIEKNFRAMPATLAAQYAKDLSALKKQEDKLKNQLKKAQAQQKIANNKCNALIAKLQSKQSAAAKKQLNTAKKVYEALTKNAHALTNQLEKMNKDSQALASKQAKFIMLGKELVKLEKQWDINAKKAIIAPKKASKKAVKAAPQEEVTPQDLFISQEATNQDATPALEPVEMDA